MKRLALAASLLFLTGCFKVSVDGLSPTGGPGTDHKVMAHSVLWGLITINEIDARRRCGDQGVWAVDSRMNGITLLANWVTAGLYSPMRVRITCRASG